MSEKTKKTTKNEKPVEEVLAEQLKAAKQERSSLKGTFEAQRKELTQQRNDSLRDDLGKRKRETNALEKVANGKKAELKAKRDTAIKEAEEEYRMAEAELSINLEEARSGAKFEYEESCGAINHQLRADCQPFIDTHKSELKETEESYELELAEIEKKEKAAIELSNATVKKLEESIAKLSKPKKKKSKKPPEEAPAEVSA